MNASSHVPPGFRFYPTDEELVDYYLRRKIASKGIDLNVIKEVDLYRIEPWDLQEICKMASEEQNEWYFFSHKDKKYPTGTRTNRATKAGFWKATGRDKAIYSKHSLIGMRKTLVFYSGRAPNGQKSDWIMHEYRLETNENGPPQEEGWVVCRVFKKRMTTTMRKMGGYESSCWYDDQVSFMDDLDTPTLINPQPYTSNPNFCFKQYPFVQPPQLESTKFQACYSVLVPRGFDKNGARALQCSTVAQEEQMNQINAQKMNSVFTTYVEQGGDQATDWRVLDKFVATQLSHEDALQESGSSFNVGEYMNLLFSDPKKPGADQQELP